MPEKPEFTPTAEELLEAITMLLMAFSPEISKKTHAKIRIRVAFLMDAFEEQGQPHVARTLSALIGALNHPVKWPKNR